MSTCCLVGCNTQSILRSTVSGKITSWYLLRLKVSRIRSATLQIKLTFSLKLFMNLFLLPLPTLYLAEIFSCFEKEYYCISYLSSKYEMGALVQHRQMHTPMLQ